MPDLFTIENKIRIVELKEYDFLKQTDVFKSTYNLIQSHQEKYPSIEGWFKEKVLSGIQSKERAVYIGFNDNEPFATAVVKKGIESKFCHLHIEKEMRHQNIGDIFFILMSIFVKRIANSVHFTLPESLWVEKRNFFNAYGFEKIEKYQTQYRRGEEELTSSVDFKILWERVLSKFPELINQFTPHPDSPFNGIVMSIRPSFSDQILDGDKLIEIRRKFNPKWKNHTVTIYSTGRNNGLVGYATIKEVELKEPDMIWSQYGDKLGCTKSEFEGYTKGCSKVYAIFLDKIHRYYNDLSLNYLSNFFQKDIHPPQSYSSVKDTEWEKIISVAEILHGRYNCFSQLY
jgi:predicted transcriptional regulator